MLGPGGARWMVNMNPHRSLCAAIFITIGLLVSACGSDPALCTAGRCAPCDCVTGCAATGFVSHTRATFQDEADLIAYCGRPDAEVACKTVVTGLAGGTPAVTTMDRDFYQLHDEWYWYHLLNGAPLPDCPRAPLAGMAFGSIDAIYTAARAMPVSDLPMDLGWAGDRLYSTHFYDLTVRGRYDAPVKVRHWVPGTLHYYPANSARKYPDALWTFAFEYTDASLAIDVQGAMAALKAGLPASVGDKLYWMARSTPWQEDLAAELGGHDPVLKGRCLVANDLLVSGDVQVIHPGITAGVLRKVAKAELATVLPTRDEIVVLEGVPDDLAPVAGILTATPQAAQAHIALLAKARGTPDAYVQGIFDDPIIDAWAKNRRPVILRLVKGKPPQFQAMTYPQWADWQRRRDGKQSLTVPTIDDPARLPVFLPLAGADDKERRRLLPLIGGKASGLATLVRRIDPDTPPAAIALTVRGYAAHIAPLEASIDALLQRPEMTGESQQVVWWRMAVLEGQAAFLARNTTDAAAQTWLAQLLENPGTAEFVKQAVLSGGVQTWVMQHPLDPTWLAAVTDAIKARWGKLAPTQRLRFRSSATVEDIDGFSAAGVYSSHTGYLRPWLNPDKKERKKTIERAIRRVWAAYWRFEAVEERRIAGLDHLAGRMAVLVHPGFGDDRETANGVMIVRVSAPTAALANAGIVTVESSIEGQIGALSVTNPPIAHPHVPERTTVHQEPGKPAVWTRVRVSSEVATVLTQAEAMALHDRVRPVALAWLRQGNKRIDAAWQRRSLQLDVEWRRVKDDWPKGTGAAGRIVLKQARPLSPRRRLSLAALEGHGAPMDLFDAALQVSKTTCACGPKVLAFWTLRTDAAWSIFPYADQPFIAYVRMTGAPGTFGSPIRAAGHVAFKSSAASLSPYAVQLTLAADMAATWGIQTLSVLDGGDCVLDGAVAISGVQCQTVQLEGGPQAWLLSLLVGG